MENAMIVGLSQQIALRRAMDVAANNIANMNTTGYKAERLSFEEYVQNIIGQEGGSDELSFVYDRNSYFDMSEGALQATNAPFDFAIEGEGYFQVETPDGVRYTRDGHFGVDDQGQLVNRDGHPVLDEGGAPILIDPELGPLYADKEGALYQAETEIGRLGVVQFEADETLRRTGGGLYETEAPPAPAVDARVRQGFIEGSNVQPIAAVTSLIEIQRSYESASKLIETADNLEREAVRKLSQR